MYLFPYKIFTISKNKRLLDVANVLRTVGIYDVEKVNYKKACELATKHDCQVSVLLGDITPEVRLMVLDLDDCYDEATGELAPDTADFLQEFSEEEYETSTSGTGIHVYILTKLKLDTFIVKDIEGCKSFECYTNKRHIVTTLFDFENTNLKVGAHDEFITNLYNKVKAIQNERTPNIYTQQVKTVFNGKEIKNEQDLNSAIYNRTPVTDMYTLRGCGYKDTNLIELIDTEPSSVDQSAHDAKLICKLMYYTLSFDSAWELATKTNYYKHKDEAHKKKFQSERYKERTRQFIERGFR